MASSTQHHSVRSAAPADEDSLVALGMSTGLFTPEEADALLRDSLHTVFESSSDSSKHVARVIDGPDDTPAGWTYLSVDADSPHAWELLWIGVRPSAQGTGVAASLLLDAENTARTNGARLLLISTSSTDVTARARAFYVKQGFAQVGRIPNYYGDGDDKILFHKGL
jgi:ribosomal protein S18 acetylase RimI-like enzyme